MTNTNETKRRKRILARINDYSEINRTDCFSVKSLSQSRNNSKVMSFSEDQVIDAVLFFQSQGLVTYNPSLKVGRLVGWVMGVA